MSVLDSAAMSAPLPRIEPEDVPAPRLEAEPTAAIRVPRRGTRTLSLVLVGIAVLAFGLAALGTVNFVAAEFARSAVLGGLTLAVTAAGFGLIVAGIWHELRGLLGLHRVDQLRAALAGTDTRTARAAARRWLADLPDEDGIVSAIAAADDPAAIAALLRAGPVLTLRARTDALSRAAAVQIFAATAAVPSPLFDGLLVGWRGLRLMRQVAELYGLRPGLLGMAALLRRTLLSAASVLTADMAANAALHGLASHPLLRHVAGDLAGATIAARRMMVLARATAAACDPVPPAR